MQTGARQWSISPQQSLKVFSIFHEFEMKIFAADIFTFLIYNITLPYPCRLFFPSTSYVSHIYFSCFFFLYFQTQPPTSSALLTIPPHTDTELQPGIFILDMYFCFKKYLSPFIYLLARSSQAVNRY